MPRWNNKNCGFQKGRIVSLETRTKIGLSNKGKIRTVENKKKLSDIHKGIPSKRKNGIIIYCLTCNKPIYCKKCFIGKKRFCSQSCSSKFLRNGFKIGHIAFNQRKSFHKTDESKIWRGRIEYRLWRESVFARDNWICQKCFIRGSKLHPHHIINFSKDINLRFAIDNGITLCEKCHRLFHKVYGVKNNNKEQIIKFIL